jgi:hypothetical protein
MFDLFLAVCPDEASSYPYGREPEGTHRHLGNGKSRQVIIVRAANKTPGRSARFRC